MSQHTESVRKLREGANKIPLLPMRNTAYELADLLDSLIEKIEKLEMEIESLKTTTYKKD